MKIIFWQNILSMHQEALLVELAKKVEVWLIYEKELNKDRKAMGWDIPLFNGVKLIPISEVDSFKNHLLKELNDDYHIFSGINAYTKLSKYFNILYKKNPYRTICFLEKPGGVSSKLENYLRLLKYKYYAHKYKDLKCILTPGGEKYLIDVGFKKEKVIPFAYFGPNITFNKKNLKINNFIKFIYIGSLTKLKNVNLVFKALQGFKNENWSLTIVGRGEEEIILKNLSNDLELSKHITFLGNKNNHEVQNILSTSDYLFLPSLYDGWGYVVNEALSKGCGVICSDACGSSSVVNGCDNSYVFSSNSINELIDIIQVVLSKGTLSINDKNKIVSFFNKELSGLAGTNQLLEILK